MYKILILIFYKRGFNKCVGVYWNKQAKKWVASLKHNKKQIHIGLFKNEKDAAKAVNWKCKELKIPMKNLEVGVLDDEELEQLKQKVITFYHFLCYFIFFWTRGDINMF
jgi:hypothetical protein